MITPKWDFPINKKTCTENKRAYRSKKHQLKGAKVGKVFDYGTHNSKKQGAKHHVKDGLLAFQNKVLAKMTIFIK